MSTTIQSEVRVKGQQSTITELRADGFVPAVVYGYKTEATSISVNERDLLKTLRVTGRNGVMKLQRRWQGSKRCLKRLSIGCIKRRNPSCGLPSN